MNYIIEKASPRDAEEIISFLKQVGAETDNLTFGAEGLALSVDAEREYIAALENSADGIMLVARHGGKIIASASLSRLPRRMSHRAEPGITILKEYWNLGIGTKLAAELIDYARGNGIERIDAQVRSDNQASLRLCEKLGFKKLCTYPGYLKINGQSIDAELLYLPL